MKDNVCTEEVNKNVLSANDNKRIQSIHSIETYEYGTSKDILQKMEKLNATT